MTNVQLLKEQKITFGWYYYGLTSLSIGGGESVLKVDGSDKETDSRFNMFELVGSNGSRSESNDLYAELAYLCKEVDKELGETDKTKFYFNYH